MYFFQFFVLDSPLLTSSMSLFLRHISLLPFNSLYWIHLVIRHGETQIIPYFLSILCIGFGKCSRINRCLAFFISFNSLYWILQLVKTPARVLTPALSILCIGLLLHLIEGKEVELEAFNSLYWIHRPIYRHELLHRQ